MPRYRVDIMYQGSAYKGWQSQTNGLAVQDVMEAALKTILRTSVRLTASSRTDAGVHAAHQVAVFDWPEPLDPYRLLWNFHGILPQDIGIKKVEQVAENFHPINNSIAKLYCYKLWLAPWRDPFLEPYIWRVPFKVDVSQLQEQAKYFLGRHDFTSFCAADSSSKTRDREIFRIDWHVDLPLVEIQILGSGFLKQMVRAIVGTLLDIPRGLIEPDTIPQIFAAKNRAMAGQTAPARGLCLKRIFFDNDEDGLEIRPR